MRISNILFSMTISLVLFSCNSKSKNQICVAGRNGNIALIVYPRHHGKSVRPYQVFLKFDVTDAPQSLGEYDIIASADTSKEYFKIGELKCGRYYIYANGYDTTALSDVKGGIPYTIGEDVTGEISVNVPVTE